MPIATDLKRYRNDSSAWHTSLMLNTHVVLVCLCCLLSMFLASGCASYRFAAANTNGDKPDAVADDIMPGPRREPRRARSVDDDRRPRRSLGFTPPENLRDAPLADDPKAPSRFDPVNGSYIDRGQVVVAPDPLTTPQARSIDSAGDEQARLSLGATSIGRNAADRPYGSLLNDAADGNEIRGQVVDQTGRPEASVLVEVRESNPPRRLVAETMTDGTGEFRFRNLQAQTQYLLVAAGRAKSERMAGYSIVTAPSTSAVVQIKPNATVPLGDGRDVALNQDLRFDDSVPRTRRSGDRNLGLIDDQAIRVSTPRILTSADRREEFADDEVRVRSDRDVEITPRADDRPARPDDDASPPRRLSDSGLSASRDPAPTSRASDELPEPRPSRIPKPSGGANEQPQLDWTGGENPLEENRRRSRSSNNEAELTPPGRPALGNQLAPATTSQRTFAGTELASLPIITSEGQRRQMQDLKGELFLLDFYASWCGPCKKIVPNLRRLDEQYRRRGLTILGIACENGDVDDAMDLANQYRDNNRIGYNLLVEPVSGSSPLRSTFGVRSFPTLILLDRNGRLLYRGTSADDRTIDELTRAIANQLGR